MSNTANLKKTEPGSLSRVLEAPQLATVIATLILCVLIISFRPFQPTGAEASGSGGDIVNQLGFGALGGLSLFALFALVDRRVLAALLSPWWLLMMVLLGFSVLTAPDTATTVRSAAFTLIGILAVAAVLTLPRDTEAFSQIFAFASLLVLGLSYAGLVLMPDVAIHGAGGIEPQHAGLWRGLFTHKNIAGPVMACLSFAGIYLWRRGWRRAGGLIFFLALIFIANTGSKTTAGTVPLAGLLVVLPGLMGMRALVPLLLGLALGGTALATLGIVFIEPLKDLADQFVPGLTYTGRTTLWAYMGDMIAARPLTGYGFESFWLTDVVTNSEQPFDRDWDIRGIIHGHNSYLDVAIAMGLPAMIVAIVMLVLAPMRDYLRVPPLKENILLADFFMMIAAFTLLNAFLESFFFRRVDPVWLFLVMSALGLRLTARFAAPAKA